MKTLKRLFCLRLAFIFFITSLSAGYSFGAPPVVVELKSTQGHLKFIIKGIREQDRQFESAQITYDLYVKDEDRRVKITSGILDASVKVDGITVDTQYLVPKLLSEVSGSSKRVYIKYKLSHRDSYDNITNYDRLYSVLVE